MESQMDDYMITDDVDGEDSESQEADSPELKFGTPISSDDEDFAHFQLSGKNPLHHVYNQMENFYEQNYNCYEVNSLKNSKNTKIWNV